MRVEHLFKIAKIYDEEEYHPYVTPGCEWVLEGKGEACRLYDGPFVELLDGGWESDADGINEQVSLAWAHLPSVEDSRDEWGLYQLITEEVECHHCEGYGGRVDEKIWKNCRVCNGMTRITRPRLVRVGEESCAWRDVSTLEGSASFALGWLEYFLGEKPSWHGILFRREADGEEQFCKVERKYLPFCKVERKYLP